MAGGVLLQNAATTGNGNEWNCRGVQGAYTLSVIGAGTISAGEVQWEQAISAGYAGTWSPLGSPITPVDGQVVTQVFEGNPQHVRARISTNIAGGGTVSVRMLPPLVDRV